MARKMTNQQLVDAFNQHCRLWLDDDASDDFSLEGVDFELRDNNGEMVVYCEGVEVARTDCRRDFMRMGDYLLKTA